MEVLGHSQIALTMNTYTHVLPELKREAAERMESLFDTWNDERPLLLVLISAWDCLP